MHVFFYRLTSGALGGKMAGLPILLLTTVGRKSGLRRTTPLMYGTEGDNLVIVASKAGMPEHPLWYTNLKANPVVDVLVRGDARTLVARDAVGEERERLWRSMADKYSGYDEYKKKTTREIPVVVLEPQG